MFAFADEKVNLGDAKWEDIHVTTGALKMFFRELPEPLFTYALFNDFVNAISAYDTQLASLFFVHSLSPSANYKKHTIHTFTIPKLPYVHDFCLFSCFLCVNGLETNRSLLISD